MSRSCNFVKIFLPDLGSDFLLVNTDCCQIVFNKYLNRKIEEYGLELENDDPKIHLCDLKGVVFDLKEHQELCQKNVDITTSNCRDLYVYEMKTGNRDRPIQDVKIYTPFDFDVKSYNELHKTLLQTLNKMYGPKTGSSSRSAGYKKSTAGLSASGKHKRSNANNLTVQD
ncbi:uncharacterized protein LOC134855592 [Symsagittifera roscoffensis]|uniref:uncharacterized protein LOC134855592 n=1 Tax=Symsagittifera roscoffensis TaxID=84072 RepID=UPI00307C99AD